MSVDEADVAGRGAVSVDGRDEHAAAPIAIEMTNVLIRIELAEWGRVGRACK